MPDRETSRLSPELQAVVRDVLDDYPLDEVVEAAMLRMREAVPEFRPVDSERMRKDMLGALGLAVLSVRDGGPRDPAEIQGLRAIGALRAEQGIDMDGMLNGFRIIAKTGVDAVIDLARDRGVPPDAVLELTRAVWEHCDEAAVELAAGHRAFTADPSRLQMRRGESSLRVLVRGEEDAARREDACRDLGISPIGLYHVVALCADPGPPTTLPPEVEARLLGSYADLEDARVIGLVEGVPVVMPGCRVGYGDPSAPTELRHSYQGAVAALELAVAFRLTTPQHPDDVRLLRPVHEMPALGDELVERCFGHLDEARRETTAETLRAWFEARGSADAAADALFVHKNTLRYRLRTFADSTGLDLDRPQDAFTVWWALRRLDALGG